MMLKVIKMYLKNLTNELQFYNILLLLLLFNPEESLSFVDVPNFVDI